MKMLFVALVLTSIVAVNGAFIPVDMTPFFNHFHAAQYYPSPAQQPTTVPFDWHYSTQTVSNTWHSNVVSQTGTVSQAFPVTASNPSYLYTVANSWWGVNDSNVYSTVTATATDGFTQTWGYVQNADLRDFNNNPSFSGTVQAPTVEIFNNGVGQRLDQQTWEFSAAWQGRTLQSITFTDNGSVGVHRIFVVAATVEAEDCVCDKFDREKACADAQGVIAATTAGSCATLCVNPGQSCSNSGATPGSCPA